jgi:hypothetical protein
MADPLAPPAPLSEVRFVHDYVQLVFQDECFSIYNAFSLHQSGRSLREGEPGFADALVGLIGQSATTAPHGGPLRIVFQGGTEIRVLVGLGNEGGPEAFQFSRNGVALIVEQND